MGRLLIYALLVFMLLSQGYGVIALGVLTGAVMIGRLLITAAISKRVLPPTMRFRLHFDRSTLSQI
jgi:hypothetical protein